MYDLEFALNDLRFNYRMWKRGMREFIRDEMLDSVLNKLKKAMDDNNRFFSTGEDIIVVEREGERFKARKISSSDSNYLSMYTLQRTKFNRWMEACNMIKDYILEYDKNMNSLMKEVYENVSSSYGEEESKTLETVSDGFDADSIINSLTQKAAELKKVAVEDKPRVSKIAIRKARRLYDTIGEVNYYYNKLAGLSNNEDILGFYELNSEYIEEDLSLNIDYLKNKLEEYRKLYDEKKPFVFVNDEEERILYFGQDEDYEMAFKSGLFEIEIAIQKAEVIKNRNYVHDALTEPVRDHAMEMIFDEVVDASRQIEEAIKDGDDYEFSDMLAWTDASVEILNKLKEKLENDYRNGNKIKVARFESDGYVVTEEENSLENYETQLEFLNNGINWCEGISNTLNEKLDEKNNTKPATGISNDVKGRSDIVEQLIEFKNNNDIDGIKKMFKEGNPGTIWSMLASEISHGLVDASEGDNLVDFITSNYDSDEIREDEVTFNSGYHNLIEILRPKRVQTLETDVTKIQKPLDVKKGKKVVRREKKKSLIEKFKGLKRWQKTAIVAGLTLAGVAIIGVGVYHLIPEVKPMIDGFIQNLHIPNFGQPISDVATQTPALPSESLVQAPQVSQAASVDYSSFGGGHRVFADAYSAASGVNPMEASGWFNGNPLDVFNVDTNEFMNLTREQLHDAEFLKTLASNPNNTMLFGADMTNPDGFVPLSEIVGEAIKGGKIL